MGYFQLRNSHEVLLLSVRCASPILKIKFLTRHPFAQVHPKIIRYQGRREEVSCKQTDVVRCRFLNVGFGRTVIIKTSNSKTSLGRQQAANARFCPCFGPCTVSRHQRSAKTVINSACRDSPAVFRNESLALMQTLVSGSL